MSYNFLDKTGLTHLWTKIKAYITKNTTPLIVGTQTARTSVWTGVAPFDTLEDGQLINFYLPFASTSTAVTLNLTLAGGGTTGALPVYYDNGTARMTTHFGRGTFIPLIYKASRVNSSGTTITNSWVHLGDRDTMDICNLRIENGSIIAGTNGVKQNSLCAMDSTGKYQSFTTTDGTGTSKTVNTSAKFRNPMIIFKNNSETNYANGAEVGTGFQSYYASPIIDLRYSCNNSANFAINTPTYLECTKDSDGYFSVTSNIILQTGFTSGRYYIYLGNTRRDQKYILALQPNHPIYYYDGSKLIDENELKTNSSVLPNDGGEIKTKYRIANKGYTGSNTAVWYYPLCKLPIDNNGDYASAIISGRIGGWVNTNMSYINALAWNRDGTGISLLDIAGRCNIDEQYMEYL